MLGALGNPLPSVAAICRGAVLNMVGRNVGVRKLGVLRIPVPAPNRFRTGGDENPTAHHREYGVQEKHGGGG